jgi:hypothetical protein
MEAASIYLLTDGRSRLAGIARGLQEIAIALAIEDETAPQNGSAIVRAHGRETLRLMHVPSGYSCLLPHPTKPDLY